VGDGGLFHRVDTGFHTVLNWFHHPEAVVTDSFGWLYHHLVEGNGDACNGFSGFATTVLIGQPRFQDPSCPVTNLVYDDIWRVSLRTSMVVVGLVLAWRLVKAARGHRSMPAALVESIVPVFLVLMALHVGPAVIAGLASFTGTAGWTLFKAFAQSDPDLMGSVRHFFVNTGVFAFALSRLPFLGTAVYLVGLVFLTNLVYLVFLLATRFVVLVYCTATAPLVIPLAINGQSRAFQAWLTMLRGALLVPIVAGIGMGVTLRLATGLGGKGLTSALMGVTMLLAGTAFTSHQVAALTGMRSHFVEAGVVAEALGLAAIAGKGRAAGMVMRKLGRGGDHDAGGGVGTDPPPRGPQRGPGGAMRWPVLASSGIAGQAFVKAARAKAVQQAFDPRHNPDRRVARAGGGLVGRVAAAGWRHGPGRFTSHPDVPAPDPVARGFEDFLGRNPQVAPLFDELMPSEGDEDTVGARVARLDEAGGPAAAAHGYLRERFQHAAARGVDVRSAPILDHEQLSCARDLVRRASPGAQAPRIISVDGAGDGPAAQPAGDIPLESAGPRRFRTRSAAAEPPR
jgi:hypothetical protein